MSLSPQTLRHLISLIEHRLGLSATTLNRTGLADLISQISEGNPAGFVRSLHSSEEHQPDWQRLIHALTIGETYFLRDKEHFRILREHILPKLVLERSQMDTPYLKIWCAGCSTGEEAYSIATVLYETLPNLSAWNIQIVASDINQRAIDVARAGAYRDWSFRHTPESFRQKYFTHTGERWQIAPAIQQMVTFQRMNALSGIALNKADIIFTRHMLMYLNESSATKIERYLYQALVPGGWLLLGQAEALHSDRDKWRLHLFPGTPVYQKPTIGQTTADTVSYPAQPAMERVQNQPVSDDSARQYQLAIEAIHADAPERAGQHISAVLDQNPDHIEAHILLSAILANLKLYPEALAHLKVPLKTGLYGEAHYIKALILLEQGQEDDAVQSLLAAIYCDRNHALAGLLLGNIYQRRGDDVRAARNWRNALKAVESKRDEEYVSIVSDMTVARLRGMISRQQTLLDTTKPDH